jgi:osmotically-inducible protein OsmY
MGAGHVQATVENGWVTLTGSVKWEYERNSAEDAVRFLPGVKGVSNDITLKPTVQPTAVKDAIEKALKRNAEIDAENIKVSANGGKVTLAGTVRSWDERDEARSAAWNAPGVTEVENDLLVSV